SVIVDTNQGECFDEDSEITCPSFGQDFYGQDGNYGGNQPSYLDNGDGTVTDLNTGLMWLQDAGDKVDYFEGVNAVDSFEFAGYDDWRVPTIKELYSLMDFSGEDVDLMTSSVGDPFIDDEVFVFEYGDTSNGERIIDSQWITDTIYVSTVMNNQECFFGVNFADGRIKCYPTSSGTGSGYFMRLVRGSVGYGENNYVDNGDGTISDESSGLIWQQGDSGEGMDWESALNYCEDLSLAGYSDWRLPDAKELQYIVDYSRSPDTTSSPAIDSIFSTTSITNLLNEKDYPFFWTGTTHKNQRGAESAVYISFGRGMGAMDDNVMDVHGAGCQRSDPKTGDESNYPAVGHGPQGDMQRVFNYVRCVRG
ncbi:MAG: DUF1566 domain-containing protein, partial [Bacteroidales bacterium]|nr:DUF1566 domain-containing protein [Bacteroidales bacterium]